jgi:hypothetical protein
MNDRKSITLGRKSESSRAEGKGKHTPDGVHNSGIVLVSIPIIMQSKPKNLPRMNNVKVVQHAKNV